MGIRVSNGSLVAQSLGKVQQCNLTTHRFISLCGYQIVAWCDVVKLLVCVVSLVGVALTVVQRKMCHCVNTPIYSTSFSWLESRLTLHLVVMWRRYGEEICTCLSVHWQFG